MFSLRFIVIYAGILWQGFPLLAFLVLAIMGQGWFVGKREGWHWVDTMYYSFITATTVGYGDMRPTHKKSKLQAIAIAFTGLILTGIMVALAIEAVGYAYEVTETPATIMDIMDQIDAGQAKNM